MRETLYSYKGIVAFVAMLFLWTSCENDAQKVRALSTNERIPMEVQENFKLQYTDSTYLRMLLRAELAESYLVENEIQREFPKGLHVEFFDGNGLKTSSLEADYALQLPKKNLWEARGNVLVVNKKGEKLETEKLFWDSMKEEIYGDDFVKITTDKQIIMGEGFAADQNFSTYEIDNVTGIINIDDA